MTRHCRHPLRVLGLVTLALFITVTSAACTADDDAHTPALPTAADGAAPAPTTTTPSPTPTTVKPDLPVPPWPDGAREPTVEGLKIAAEYYFDDLVDYMSITGDTAPFSAVCPGNLSFCYGFTTDTIRMHDAGDYLVNGEFTLRDIETSGKAGEGSTVYYSANGRIGAGHRFSDDGTLVATFSPNDFFVEANFEFRDGLWIVTAGYMKSSES